MHAQPFGVHCRSDVQRVTYGLGHTLQAGHGANGAKDVGRITALAATGFQQIMRLNNRQDGLEDAALGAVGQQPSAECRQDCMVKADVGTFQTWTSQPAA